MRASVPTVEGERSEGPQRRGYSGSAGHQAEGGGGGGGLLDVRVKQRAWRAAYGL